MLAEAFSIVTQSEDPSITHCGGPECERCKDSVLGGPILGEQGRVARIAHELPEADGSRLPDATIASYERDFLTAMNDDINTPKVLAIVWDLTIRSNFLLI